LLLSRLQILAINHQRLLNLVLHVFLFRRHLILVFSLNRNHHQTPQNRQERYIY